MDVQRLITLAVVVVAAIYLSRNVWGTIRGLFGNKPGCGCGKCGFAIEPASEHVAESRRSPEVIPLTEIERGRRR